MYLELLPGFLVDLVEEVVEQLVLLLVVEQEIVHQYHHHKEILVDLLQEMMQEHLVGVVRQHLAAMVTFQVVVLEVRDPLHLSAVPLQHMLVVVAEEEGPIRALHRVLQVVQVEVDLVVVLEHLEL
jgi:hypothetical protein